MRVILSVLAPIFLLIIAGCVEEFSPVLPSIKYYLVVNGLITDQPEAYTVRLSWSVTPGEKMSVPLPGCDVKVYDDEGYTYQFTESSAPGEYISDTATFRGVVGRKYKLRINTNNASPRHYSYESEPVEMKEVPPIDSLYYEKVLIYETSPGEDIQEGYQIYLDTHDPNRKCVYYRWEYNETWKFEIPFLLAINRRCWASNNSQNIDVKSTVVLSEDRVSRHPVTLITNETNRLSVRYSINVNQFSLSEREFEYWEKVRNVVQDVGGLYDIIPSSINGNLFCIEDPVEPVLGYFSVSARASKRIYMNEKLPGTMNPYEYCPADTSRILDPKPPVNLSEGHWLLDMNHDNAGYYIVLTHNYYCVDCTTQGTTKKPEFWQDFN